MARRVIQELIDDIDGTVADESISFGLDGVQYEIDLSAKNASKLRDSLASFVEASTRVGRSPAAPARGREAGRGRETGRARGSSRSDREQNRAIREWAQSKGIDVSDRGRIKQEIVERYNAEH